MMPGEGTPAAAPEVQFALALSRTIEALREDPAQLRHTVYEQARTALWRDLARGDPEYGARLAEALETAIVGVEQFAALEDRKIARSNRIGLAEAARAALPPSSSRAVAPYSPDVPPPSYLIRVDELRPQRQTILDVAPQDIEPLRRRSFPFRMAFGILAVAVLLVASAIAARQPQGWHLPDLRAQNWTAMPGLLSGWSARLFGGAAPQPSPRSADDLAWARTTPLRQPGPDEPAAATARSGNQMSANPNIPMTSIPLPTTYGSFAFSNGQLLELALLEGTVPDRRVAIASPFQTPSHTVLADGSPTFVIFRRDLASIASDSIEVRVVAQITRTMKFDSGAKPGFAAEDQLWSVRGIAYKFKASPVPGNPEVMLARPENPDMVLPPGRYVLVLKRQAYDFTVAGQVTDPSHCLERTEAANGTFYSPCAKVQ
jgi:hypothetical protein